ncbi:MAG: uroporphyrinogen decarboxylase family protein [Planctomycetota bacterium]
MSYQDGLAAINLDMPKRVPRTEYSVEFHWELIKRVTGFDVNSSSPAEKLTKAYQALYKAWNYDLMWGTLVYNQIFGNLRTDMGHSEYMTGGEDRRDASLCPFKTHEEALSLDPFEAYGKINKPEWTQQFEADYQKKKSIYPDLVNMTGVYVTCISGLVEIFGWEMLLLAAGTDSDSFGELTNRYCSWILQFFEALAEADVPVVMVHDDIVWSSGAIFNPKWYRKYVFPNYKKLFRPVLDSGKKLLYTSDGNYTQFVDDIADCGVSGFALEPTTDMKYIADKYGKTHVIIGNADTRILLTGTTEEIRSEVMRCMDIGKKCPGYFLAVGNHIPPNTPVENALYYNRVYEELCQR